MGRPQAVSKGKVAGMTPDNKASLIYALFYTLCLICIVVACVMIAMPPQANSGGVLSGGKIGGGILLLCFTLLFGGVAIREHWRLLHKPYHKTLKEDLTLNDQTDVLHSKPEQSDCENSATPPSTK